MTDAEARATVALKIHGEALRLSPDFHVDAEQSERFAAAFVKLAERVINLYLNCLFDEKERQAS